jgi:hypothetical protein
VQESNGTTQITIQSIRKKKTLKLNGGNMVWIVETETGV